MRIAKCISHIMEVSGTTELEIGQKPTTVEEYESLKNKLVDISFIAIDFLNLPALFLTVISKGEILIRSVLSIFLNKFLSLNLFIRKP